MTVENTSSQRRHSENTNVHHVNGRGKDQYRIHCMTLPASSHGKHLPAKKRAKMTPTKTTSTKSPTCPSDAPQSAELPPLRHGQVSLVYPREAKIDADAHVHMWMETLKYLLYRRHQIPSPVAMEEKLAHRSTPTTPIHATPTSASGDATPALPNDPRGHASVPNPAARRKHHHDTVKQHRRHQRAQALVQALEKVQALLYKYRHILTDMAVVLGSSLSSPREVYVIHAGDTCHPARMAGGQSMRWVHEDGASSSGASTPSSAPAPRSGTSHGATTGPPPRVAAAPTTAAQKRPARSLIQTLLTHDAALFPAAHAGSLTGPVPAKIHLLLRCPRQGTPSPYASATLASSMAMDHVLPKATWRVPWQRSPSRTRVVLMSWQRGCGRASTDDVGGEYERAPIGLNTAREEMRLGLNASGEGTGMDLKTSPLLPRRRGSDASARDTSSVVGATRRGSLPVGAMSERHDASLDMTLGHATPLISRPLCFVHDLPLSDAMRAGMPRRSTSSICTSIPPCFDPSPHVRDPLQTEWFDHGMRSEDDEDYIWCQLPVIIQGYRG